MEATVSMKNGNVSFNPTMEQLCEIERWSQEEDNKYRQGFYCNWNIIERNFNLKRMTIISSNEKVIGFAIWQFDGYIADINITEIKRGFRKKGYGSILVNAVLEYFLNKGVYIVRVHCQPHTSEKYWKKVGFIDYPDVRAMQGYRIKYSKHLYKILVPSSQVNISDQASEQIELWDDEPDEIFCNPPKWIWPLSFKPGTKILIEPIIHPCYNDWQVRWTKNGVIAAQDKVKYFPKEIEYGTFMIITELP